MSRDLGHFFSPTLALGDQVAELEGTEAHHLRTVCRGKPGDRLFLLNGYGVIADGVLQHLARDHCQIEVTTTRLVDRPSRRIELAITLPKGDRANVLVEKATELGVDTFLPIRSERSVVDAGDGKLARLERVALEACKQCGRAYLPEWSPVQNFFELLRARRGGFLDLMGELHTTLPQEWPEADALLALVGPEGGWTPEEREAAHALGWLPIRFPSPILRIETAGIAWAALAALWRASR